MKNVTICPHKKFLVIENVADCHPGPEMPSAADGASMKQLNCLMKILKDFLHRTELMKKPLIPNWIYSSLLKSTFVANVAV